MILTVTPNPSMDRTVEVPGLRAGGTFGASLVTVRPAGKGVNVSRCLAALGVESTATGLVGRDAAPEFHASLAEVGISPAFVETTARVRTSTTMIDPRAGGGAPVVTHLRERGGEVSPDEVDELEDVVARRAPASGWVAACGSLPQGVTAGRYAAILLVARERGARVALDSSGEGLAAAAEIVPDLLKPNRAELAELVRAEVRELGSPDSVLAAARSVVGGCAKTLLVTLGQEGAMLIGEAAEGRALLARAQPERVVSSVGAGDAALAGYLWAETTGKPPEDCLRAAVAAGAASLAEPYAGALDRERFERLLEHTEIDLL